MLISAKISTKPKSKVFQKNLPKDFIRMVHRFYDFLLLRYVKCKILLTHTYTKMPPLAKTFTRSKLKVFDKNLTHQRIS